MMIVMVVLMLILQISLVMLELEHVRPLAISFVKMVCFIDDDDAVPRYNGIDDDGDGDTDGE